MTEFNEVQLKRWLREAVGAPPTSFDAETWRRRHADDLARLGAGTGSAISGATSRVFGGRGYRLFARPAAIAAALAIVVLAGIWLVSGKGHSARLFAQTLQHLQQESYGFALEVWIDDELHATTEALVAEPGRLRYDHVSHLGSISTIADVETAQTAVLFHRSKAVYLFDEPPEVPIESAPLAFLAQPGRSIINLWSLRAGEERPRGRRVIDGREVEGFEVDRDTGTGHETITVWADVHTGVPVQVDVEVAADMLRSLPSMYVRLRDFDLSVDPEPRLFVMAPEGYTRASIPAFDEWLAQEHLTAESYALAEAGRSVISRTFRGSEAIEDDHEQTMGLTAEEAGLMTEQAPGPTPEQQVIEMFQAVEAEQYDEAITRMCALDWSKAMTFEGTPPALALTERDAIALTSADRLQMVGEVMMTLKHLRTMARQVIAQAAEDRDAGRLEEAETLLISLRDFGLFLHDDEQRMRIVKLVGIAIEQEALDELSALYSDTGRRQKYAEVEMRNVELDQIRREFKE